MTNSIVDYITTYFEFPVLIQIHDKSVFDNLEYIKDQLKKNCECVTSELGGGARGYLVIILNPT